MNLNPGMSDIRKVLDRMRVITAKDALSIQTEIGKIADELEELLVTKGGDYSSIFEHEFGAPVLASKIRGESAHNHFATLIALKCARAINISFMKGNPTYEDLKGTWQDFINYMVLWVAFVRYMEESDALRADSTNQSST